MHMCLKYVLSYFICEVKSREGADTKYTSVDASAAFLQGAFTDLNTCPFLSFVVVETFTLVLEVPPLLLVQQM